MKKKILIPIYDQALKYLDAKMYSEADLAWKLKNKGYSGNEIKEVTERLKEENFLNDARYGDIYFQNLVEYRTFGYYGIKLKLIQKRLPKSLVEKIMRRLDTDTELVIGERLLGKSRKKTKESLINSLKQKGFRIDAILKLIKNL